MSELRDSLKECNPKHAALLRNKIQALRKDLPKTESRLTYKVLKAKLNLVATEEEFSRFVTHATDKKTGKPLKDMLDSRDHHAVVDYLFQHGFWSERPQSTQILEVKDYAFHALVLYLNIGVGTQENIAIRACGNYLLYRPSAHRPGDYVRGYLVIDYTPDSHALVATEVQGYSGADTSRPIRQEFDGYLFRKDKKYFIISRDEGHRGIRVMFINGIRHEGKPISIMTGAVMELEMKHIVSVPVYLERTECTVAELDKLVDIVSESDVPSTVKAYLHAYKVESDISYY